MPVNTTCKALFFQCVVVEVPSYNDHIYASQNEIPHGGMEEEDDLTLSEDEEYDYRVELEDAGIDEPKLFVRHGASSPATALWR